MAGRGIRYSGAGVADALPVRRGSGEDAFLGRAYVAVRKIVAD